MNDSRTPSVPTEPYHASANSDVAGQSVSTLASVLQSLDEAPPQEPADQKKSELVYENKLVQVRLGVASALFASLRAKHPPSAAHSLRVALACSSWALNMNITEEERDEIEVAALLHDIGKIGVPDYILRKPGKLTDEEASIIEEHRQSGLEILAACSPSREILDIVFFASAWFDGSRQRFDRWRDRLPLGARMVAIVDAFDAMTTDHVYRRAMSRERAMAELFECAGTQFDPELVKTFCGLMSTDRVKFNATVAKRWLQELHPEASNAIWCLGRLSESQRDVSVDGLFQQKLVDSMHDGVIFVDSTVKVIVWNRAAERLTGIPASGILQKQWVPSLVEMRDEDESQISDEDCPIAYSIKSCVQTMRRMSISGRGKQAIAIDVHVVPVVARDGVAHGATILLHDASSQINLEEQVQTLNIKATSDPLTGIANRAEFDQTHERFVETHLEQNLPCALIICDLDFFKRINDNYGHQAGDDALISFSQILNSSTRTGDLAARYGGEEFVLLCADCDNATATERAEQIRQQWSQTPHETLAGRTITASFGVTELQAGDTPETMLRRADRALLQAKDLGRNTVVQLGSGITEKPASEKKTGWFSWFKSTPCEELLQRTLITPVPLKVVAEKLRGFVADHHAEITAIDEEHIVLKIDGQNTGMLRRQNDRPVPFLCELKFDEKQQESADSGGKSSRTLVFVSIRPIRNRDRRRRNVVERARQLVASLKSYLMAQDFAGSNAVRGDESEGSGVFEKAKGFLKPLFGNSSNDDR